MRILARPWEESSYTQYAPSAIRYFWITIWTHVTASCWTCTRSSCWLRTSFTLTSKSCHGVRSIFNLWLFAMCILQRWYERHPFLLKKDSKPGVRDWICVVHTLPCSCMAFSKASRLIDFSGVSQTNGREYSFRLGPRDPKTIDRGEISTPRNWESRLPKS